MLTQIMPSIFEGRMTMRVAFANLCLEGKGAESYGGGGPLRKSCRAFLARLPKHPPSQPRSLPRSWAFSKTGVAMTSERGRVWPQSCHTRVGATDSRPGPQSLTAGERRIRKNTTPTLLRTTATVPMWWRRTSARYLGLCMSASTTAKGCECEFGVILRPREVELAFCGVSAALL